MFSSKKITTIIKNIVSRIPLAALLVILGMVGTAAASGKPKSIVVSTFPTDDAVDVPVNTTVTVNFSLPMDCKTINKNNFRLKDIRHGRLAAESVSCSGTSATLTPLSDLAVSTRYEVVLHGKIRALNGTLLWDNGWGYDFTTSPNARPPATATPTATATVQPQPRLQPQRPLRLQLATDDLYRDRHRNSTRQRPPQLPLRRIQQRPLRLTRLQPPRLQPPPPLSTATDSPTATATSTDRNRHSTPLQLQPQLPQRLPLPLRRQCLPRFPQS